MPGVDVEAIFNAVAKRLIFGYHATSEPAAILLGSKPACEKSHIASYFIVL